MSQPPSVSAPLSLPSFPKPIVTSDTFPNPASVPTIKSEPPSTSFQSEMRKTSSVSSLLDQQPHSYPGLQQSPKHSMSPGNPASVGSTPAINISSGGSVSDNDLKPSLSSYALSLSPQTVCTSPQMNSLPSSTIPKIVPSPFSPTMLQPSMSLTMSQPNLLDPSAPVGSSTNPIQISSPGVEHKPSFAVSSTTTSTFPMSLSQSLGLSLPSTFTLSSTHTPVNQVTAPSRLSTTNLPSTLPGTVPQTATASSNSSSLPNLLTSPPNSATIPVTSISPTPLSYTSVTGLPPPNTALSLGNQPPSTSFPQTTPSTTDVSLSTNTTSNPTTMPTAAELTAQQIVMEAARQANKVGSLVPPTTQSVPVIPTSTVPLPQRPFLGVGTAPSTLPPQTQISSVFTSAPVTQPPLTSISGAVSTQGPIAPPMGPLQPVSLLGKYE